MGTLYVKSNGVWQPPDKMYVKHANVWKEPAAYVRRQGQWELVYPPANPDFDFATGPLDPLITFNRASPGMFYNVNGILMYSGHNVMWPSEDFTASGWTKTNGATVTANAIIAPNGLLTADRLNHVTPGAPVNAGYIAKSCDTESPYYIASIYAKAGTKSWLAFGHAQPGSPRWSYYNLATGTLGYFDPNYFVMYGMIDAGNGWWRCWWMANDSWNCSLYMAPVEGSSNTNSIAVTSPGDIYLWGAQGEQVTTETAPRTYLPAATTPTGLPRFEYDPATHEPKGILIESARSLFFRSQSFGWTTSSATVTQNVMLGPDATMTAARVVSTGTPGYITQSCNISAGTNFCMSIYVKKETGDWFYMATYLAGVDYPKAYFNLTTGKMGLVNAPLVATMQDCGNGWYRCSIARMGTDAVEYLHIGPCDFNNSQAVTAGKSIILWGCQGEYPGLYPSSYLPCDTSYVRAADIAVVAPGPSFSQWYSPESGAYVITYDLLQQPGIRPALQFDNTLSGSAANKMALTSTTNDPKLTITNQGALQADFDLGTITEGPMQKAGFSYTGTIAPSSWVALYDPALGNASGGWLNFVLRTQISLGALRYGAGSQIRLTFQASNVTSFPVSAVYIGPRAMGGGPVDFAVAPTQVFFGGNPGFSLATTTGIIVSDPITLPFNSQSDIVVSLQVTTGGNYVRGDTAANLPGVLTYYKTGGGGSLTALVADQTTLGTYHGGGIEKLEIFGSLYNALFEATFNGGPVQSSNVGALPPVTQMRLGSDGGNYLNGHVLRIQYYPDPKDGAELQALTAPTQVTIVAPLSFTSAEAKVVGRLKATGSGTIAWTITGGTDAAKFDLDLLTGDLSFKTAPDFELPGDANADNVYSLTVQASNTGTTDTKTVTVTVVDLNEGLAFDFNFLSGTLDPRLTFARQVSIGSATDSAGLIYIPRNNLVGPSENFSPPGWTLTPAAGASVTADYTTAPNSTQTADRINVPAGGTTVSHAIENYGPSSTNMIMSVYAKAGSKTWVAMAGSGNYNYFNLATGAVGNKGSGTNSIGMSDAGNGWWRCWAVMGTQGTQYIRPVDANGASTVVAAGDMYLWGAQTETVPNTQTLPGSYLLTSGASYYGPRFDWDPLTHLPRGLLIEETRRNQFTDTSNILGPKNNITITVDQTIAPDGLLVADKIAATAVKDCYVYGGSSISSGAYYSQSVYLKAGTATWAALMMYDGETAPLAWFNLSNGTIGTVQFPITNVYITDVGNGWYRCAAVRNSNNGISRTFQIFIVDGDNTTNVTIGKTLYAWGQQTESGAPPSVYMPMGQQLDRGQDMLSLPNQTLSQWKEGTYIVEFETHSLMGIHPIISLDEMEISLYGPTVKGIVTLAQATIAEMNAGVVGLETISRVGLSYKSNRVAISLNGDTVRSAAATIPPCDTLYFGSNVTTQFMLGRIRSVQFYGTAKSDAELQVLTSSGLALTWTADTTLPVIFTGMVVGDVLVLEVSKTLNFAFPQTESNTLDAAEVSAGTVTMGSSLTLTPGVTYQARVKRVRSGAANAYSNQVTRTIAKTGVTLATWNAGDKNAGITLSNSDRTAALTSGSSYRAARAFGPRSSGKVHVEFRAPTSASTFYWQFGIGTITTPLNNYIGNTGYNSISIAGTTGDVRWNGSSWITVNQPVVPGVWRAIAIDFDQKTFRAWTGTYWTYPFLIDPMVQPWYLMWSGDTNGQDVEINTGQLPWAITPLADHVGWDAAAVNITSKQPGFTILQDTTAVATLSATGTPTPTWSIVGGADAAKFSIGSTTGVLAFLVAPDFEAPGDVGADNLYDVQVQASNGVTSQTRSYVVQVLQGTTATSWSTTDATTASLTYSLANAKIVITSGSGWRGARSVASRYTGKVHVEFRRALSNPSWSFGIATAAKSLTSTRVGGEFSGMGLSNTSLVYYGNNSLGSSGLSPVANTWCAMEVDFDLRQLRFWTGSAWGSWFSFAPTDGPFFLCWNSDTVNHDVEINAGQAAFAITPAAGYMGWTS